MFLTQRLFSPLLLTFLLILSSPAFTQEKNSRDVLTSIRPVYGLVSLVTQNTDTKVSLLVEGSPHGFRLLPSKVRQLEKADLIFAMDLSLEPFLKTLRAKEEEKLIFLSSAADLETLPLRENLIWKEEPNHADHSHDHDFEKEEAHKKKAQDPHFWLSPDNASVLISLITENLSQQFPQNKLLYEQNAQRAKEQLTHLKQDLKKDLTPLSEKPFVTFHDFLQYFEVAFDLHALGSLRASPEFETGAQHLKDFETLLKEQNNLCFFLEPDFEPSILKKLKETLSIKEGILDPIGASIPLTSSFYMDLLQSLKTSFQNCLSSD